MKLNKNKPGDGCIGGIEMEKGLISLGKIVVFRQMTPSDFKDFVNKSWYDKFFIIRPMLLKSHDIVLAN
jgi:hypothetical protein